jgi:hypothetical protein
MFHSGAGSSTLKYVSVADSGTSALGDYPLHWHLNGNSTRGTIVEGVVVVNGRHHAFVPHGSHGITFKDTIAKNTSGDAYWWDAPGTNESCRFLSDCTLDNSNDIMYDHALAHGVTNGPGDGRGFRLAGFMLGAGSGNVVQNSAAVNISPSHIVECSGFHWPEAANQNAGGNVWVFQNNRSVSASGCYGIFVWQNDDNHHVIQGFTGSGINHGAYGNHYEYRRVDVSRLEVHAQGWSVHDSSVGKIFVYPHVIAGQVNLTNVRAESVVMEDAPAGDANQPITVNITSPNLSCESVIWLNPHPASSVAINGSTCSR